MALTTAEKNTARFAGALKQEGNTNLNAEQKELAKKAKDQADLDREKRLGVEGSLKLMAESVPLATLQNEINAKIQDPARRAAALDAARKGKHLGELHYDVIIDPGTGMPDKNKALDVPEQDTTRAEVDSVISAIPEINNLLARGVLNKRAFIESIIKDPLFAEKIRQKLSDKRGKEVPDFNLTELRTKLNQLTSEIDNATVLENSMVTGTNLNLAPATKASELAIRQSNVDTLRGSADPARRALVIKIDNFRNLRTDRAMKQDQLNKVTAELAAGVADPAKLAELTNKQTNLTTEVGGLATQMLAFQPNPGNPEEILYLQSLDTIARTEANSKVSQLTAEKAATNHAIAVAETQKTAADNAYIDGLKKITEEATVEYLQDRLRSTEPSAEDLVKQKEEAKTAEDKKYVEDKEKARIALRLHWRKKSGKADSRKAKSSFDKLLQTNPEQMVQEALAKIYKKGGGIDAASISRLLKDEAFLQDAAGSVVRARLESGKFTRDEINMLADTDWGEKAITSSYEKDDKAKALIGKAQERGKLRGDGWFKELLSKAGEHKKGVILAILAAIAAGVGYPALVGLLAAEGLTWGAAGVVAEGVKSAAVAASESGLTTAAVAGGAGLAAYKLAEK